jgi:hypothetical protein
MKHVVRLIIKPANGKAYDLLTEFDATGIADVMRTMGEDAERHERSYMELADMDARLKVCQSCKHFREHTYKVGTNLDGHCDLHSFSEKYPDEYFDTWADSTCDEWDSGDVGVIPYPYAAPVTLDLSRR